MRRAVIMEVQSVFEVPRLIRSYLQLHSVKYLVVTAGCVDVRIGTKVTISNLHEVLVHGYFLTEIEYTFFSLAVNHNDIYELVTEEYLNTLINKHTGDSNEKTTNIR